MSRNIILKDLAKPEEIKVLTDYLKEAFENGDVIYTTSAPNGSISAVRGKFALYLNGSTYELWQNTNGGTTWQRIDAGLSIPLTYLDTDGTLAANSDVKVASQKATKTYVDTKVPVPLTAPLGGTGATAAANAASGVVVLNASSQLPAVSGALLTNLPVSVVGDAVGIFNVAVTLTTGSQWYDITGVSVSITLSQTGTIVASFSGKGVADNKNLQYRILYDSTSIASINLGTMAVGGQTFGVGGKATSVAAGTYTVKLQAMSTSGDAGSVTFGALTVSAF